MLQHRTRILVILLVFLPFFWGEAGGAVSAEEQVKPWDEGIVDYRQPPYDQIEIWKNSSAYRYDREVKPVGFWAILWSYILQWFLTMSQSGNWLMGLVIILGVGLVIWLLVRIFNVPVSGLFFLSRTRQKSDLRFMEGHLDLSGQNLEEMLVLYRNNKAYREAVRLLFLLYLQQLQADGLIRLNTVKTNQEYLREISNPAERVLFKKRMGLFDHVWYGQAPVSDEIYQKVEQAFDYQGGEEVSV